MRSSITKSFRADYARLPRSIRTLARKNYRLWLQEPRHPSLHFKQIGNYWSVRVGLGYRALGREKNGILYWFWIGHHKLYDRMISQL
jgi:hypothetical protein